MKTKLVMIGLAVSLGMMSQAAFAHQSACSADIAQFCAGDAGWKQIGACLAQNESQLSAPCTQARQKRKAKWEARVAAFHAACDANIQTYCSNAAAASDKPWEVRQCLKTNENSLTSACQAALQHKHHHHQGQQTLPS